jgi:hypothetical protein
MPSRQCGPRWTARAGFREYGSFRHEEDKNHRAPEPGIPRRTVRHIQPSELRQPGERDHHGVNLGSRDLDAVPGRRLWIGTADPILAEAAVLVRAEPSQQKGASEYGAPFFICAWARVAGMDMEMA